jgi:hypothetical protein
MSGPNVVVANIRECYNGVPKAHGDPVVAVVKNPWPPSDAQIKYVLGLQVERVLPDDYKVKEDHDLRAMDKGEVSGLIGMLKLLRRSDSVKDQPTWTMPSGRYAIYFPGADDTPGAYSYVDRQDLAKPSYGQWQFYAVDKPTEGRWKGYTFIKRLIGGSQDGGYRKVDMTKESREAVLKAIEGDYKKAMLDFGLQSGSCGHCGRALSNKESLERGIGPICAGKMGW